MAFNILTIIVPMLWVSELDIISFLLLVASMSFISFISFILFLAFMKFYRRYSLEIFMILISDDELLQKSDMNYSNNVNVNIQTR